MFMSSGNGLEAKIIGHEDNPYTNNKVIEDV